MTKPIPNTQPKIGQTMMVRGTLMTIVRVYPLGTVDVTDGQRYWRVTGLGFS